ncbi:MAG: hypothetical protein WCJ56_10185, partial [bacterium]
GGGLGHVTRAAAILRQLPLSIDAQVLTTVATPYPLIHEGIPFHHFAEEEFPNNSQEYLQKINPKVLVMDVFPYGLHEELRDILPSLPCKKVFIYRHVLAGYRAIIDSALPLFDLVIQAETAEPPLAVPAIDCQPILLREEHELLNRDEARGKLEVTDDRPVVLGVSSGDTGWTASFFSVLRKALANTGAYAQLRLAAPEYHGEEAIAHYPLIELLPGIDVLVGAGGYNLYHEGQACGTPVIFLPQPRLIDDQYWRTRNTPTANSPEELEARLREALATSRQKTHFCNHAAKAAMAIASFIHH